VFSDKYFVKFTNFTLIKIYNKLGMLMMERLKVTLSVKTIKK